MLKPLAAEGSEFIQDEGLLARLKKCTNLPSAPGVAEQVLALGQDSETTLPQIAKVVSRDPALSAKLLRIANSPFYARRRKTENLRQAITLFGLNGSLTLVLSFSTVRAFQRDAQSGLDYAMFWRRSFTVAACCQLLAEQMKITDKEDLFLAGLLQDIGILALDRVLPGLYREIEHTQKSHRQLQAFEQAEMGADHAAVGAWLLNKWNFPDRLVQVVAGSHDPNAVAIDDVHQPMARIVAFSSDIADILWNPSVSDKIGCAMQRARRVIDVEPDMLAVLFENVAEQLRNVADIFDIDLGDTMYLEALQEQAKEILTLRNLQALNETKLLQEHKSTLETKTRELEEINRRDNLTKVFNRAYLDNAIREEFEAARAHGWPLAIAFIDLDHFKDVNDRFGHQAGDTILKSAAKILAQQARGGDIVTRYGGEEFVVILPGTGREGAELLCHRLVETFRSTSHAINNESVIVTVSVGVAVHGEREQFQGWGDLLRAADRAVYRAKLDGRDRWVWHQAVVA